MPFVDDVNRILRDHLGYSGDGHGGNGPLPVGDRSTARKPIINRDLRELLIQMAQTMGDPSALQVLIDQIAAKADAVAVNLNGVKFYDNRTQAIERDANLLPSGIVRIMTVEAWGVAVRARNSTEDALYDTTPRWGISHRLSTQAFVDAAFAVAIQRANHTGTQPISTVSGLSAALDGLSQARIDGDEALSGRIDQEEAARAAQGVTLSALIDRSTIGLTGIMGPANAIQAIIPSQLGITDIPIGARVSLRGTGANTGPVTLSVNEGTERPVLDGKGRPLVGGELSNTTPFEARRMNETEYRIVSSLTHPADLAAEVSVLTAADEVNLTLASMPGQMAGEFHNGGENDPILAFLDDKGIALGIDPDGFLIERIGGEFHNDYDQELAGLLFVDEDLRVLLTGSGASPDLTDRVTAAEHRLDGVEGGLSAQSNRITDVEDTSDAALALATALQGAAASGVTVFASVAEGLAATADGGFFAVSDGGPDYQVLYERVGAAAEERGRLQSLINLPSSELDAGEGRAWRQKGSVKLAAQYPPSFAASAASLFSDHQGVYAHYENLMAEYPHYITRTVIGHDALGNEVRQYRFNPPGTMARTWAEEDAAVPKIVLLGGIHGHERNALATYMTYADELCRNWRNDEYISDLRWGCEVIMIPCVCPSGIDLNTRKNHNGVDLNRNFPFNWADGGSTDPGSSYYRGPAAASEAETQIMMQMFSDHSDAFAFVDHHNSSSLSTQGFAAWIGIYRSADLGPALETLYHMEMWSRREIETIPENSPAITRVTENQAGTMAGWMNEVGEKPAYLLETPQSGGLGSLLNQRRHAFEMTRVLASKIFHKAVLTRTMQD